MLPDSAVKSKTAKTAAEVFDVKKSGCARNCEGKITIRCCAKNEPPLQSRRGRQRGQFGETLIEQTERYRSSISGEPSENDQSATSRISNRRNTRTTREDD